MLSHRA
jgi:meiotic recombination protein DMC1